MSSPKNPSIRSRCGFAGFTFTRCLCPSMLTHVVTIFSNISSTDAPVGRKLLRLPGRINGSVSCAICSRKISSNALYSNRDSSIKYPNVFTRLGRCKKMGPTWYGLFKYRNRHSTSFWSLYSRRTILSDRLWSSRISVMRTNVDSCSRQDGNASCVGATTSTSTRYSVFITGVASSLRGRPRRACFSCVCTDSIDVCHVCRLRRFVCTKASAACCASASQLYIQRVSC